MKKLKKDILLIIKGLKEIHSICKGLLGLTVLRSVVNALVPFINIYMSGLIIDKIAAKAEMGVLILYAAFTVVANLITALAVNVLNRFINYKQFKFDARYEMKVSHKIIDMDYASVEDPNTHMLNEKIKALRSMNEGGIYRILYSFPVMIQVIFTVVFSVSLTLSLFTTVGGKRLSGFSLIIASPAISVVLGLGILANAFISMHANTTVIQKMYSIFNDLIPFNRIYGYYLINYVMTYHPGKDIRIYNQKGLIKEESMSLYKDLTGTLDKLSKNQLKYSGVITVCAVIINSLVYLFVGLKALAGLFGVGSVVRYVGSINEFTNGFISIVSQFSMLRANNEALEVYFSYMSIQSFMNQGTLSIDRQSICKNGFKDQDIVLEFRNVNFKYPSTDSYTLHNISIKIKNGERIAIVGENGSGKTTFIKLLCRLYDPNDGQILLNGTDIRKYDYNDYTSIFSVVFQDFSLFSFSLGQNVASAVEYNKAKVEACLKQVGFGDRLEKMKSGIETCLYKDFDE